MSTQLIGTQIDNSLRPRITLNQTKTQVLHSYSSTRVVFTKDFISVGCSDITPEAAEYLLEQYRKHFPKDQPTTVVLQP